MENDKITSEEMGDFFEFEKKTPVKKQRKTHHPSVDYKTMSAIELLKRVLKCVVEYRHFKRIVGAFL